MLRNDLQLWGGSGWRVRYNLNECDLVILDILLFYMIHVCFEAVHCKWVYPNPIFTSRVDAA